MRAAPDATQQGGRDVFISYASENIGVARRLKGGLDKRGVTAWLDKREFGASDKISATIRDGVQNSLVFAPILSKDYFGSEKTWPLLEFGMFLARAESMAIVPILYGITHKEAARRLSPLLDTHMEAWDDGSAEAIMDQIFKLVAKLKRGPRQNPPAGGGNVGEDPLQLFAAASDGAMAGLPKTAAGMTISRKKQVQDIERLLAKRGRVVIVGDKGSGKSVMLCQLYEKIAKERPTIFISCEDLQGMPSAKEMNAAIVPGRDFLGIVARLQEGGRRPVVILDSLDAVGRNEGAMRAFKRLLARIWGQNATTVATVRGYDYEYSEIIGATDWGEKYDMPLLAGKEVDAALERAAVPCVAPAEKALIANPLHLHLFLQVADATGGTGPGGMGREIDLYDSHWHHHVERAPESRKIQSALYDIAEGMCAERRTAVSADAIKDHGPVDYALRQGILVRKKYDQVSFFHPAYMDYAMSRSLLARHSSLTEFIRGDEYNMFLRPTLALALEMALLRDEEESEKMLEEMLRSDLKHAWKVLAAQALAGVRAGRHERFQRVGAALTENDMLQRHFVAELAKRGNRFWLGAWGETFFARWASAPNNPNAVLMTEYLRTAAADPGLHGRIFAIARLVAENNAWGVARRKAVEALSGIDAAGATEWLEAMSRHAEPHVRAGVMHNIEALLERDRHAVPRIFANLFTYEEKSAEKTTLLQHGSLVVGSNKMQDNWLIRWELCRLFPRILEHDPPTAARAAILVHERNHGPKPGAESGELIDDDGAGADWLHLGASDDEADEKSLAAPLAAHLGQCGGAEFRWLAPLLRGTRIATFRSMLIDGMLQRKGDYMEELAETLSDASTYGARTLHASAKNAIREVAGLLSDGDLARILAAVMASNPPKDSTEVEIRRSEAARAAFLEQFPQERLRAEHLALVKRHAAPARPPDPPFPTSFEFQEMDEPQRPHPAGAGAQGGAQGTDARIARLEAVSESLEARPGAVGGAALDEMEQFLIECKDDPDPAADVEDERGSPMVVRPSVRGLAAAGLARLLAHRKSRRAAAALAELSDDPVNLVRGDVSHALERLVRCDHGLALRIALRYSRDPDARPRYFLHGAIRGIAAKSPPRASAIVRNMLSMGGGDPRILARAIVWLALAKRDKQAAEMLGGIADRAEFDEGLRAAIPHALQRYLLDRERQDEAIGVLYRLFKNDPSPAVRQKAAFFTLNWPETARDDDDRALALKIEDHLDLMASTMKKEPFDVFIAESMVQFLEKHWSIVPRKALRCLEAMALDPGRYAATQPALADGSARVLAGLLQHHTLSDDEWRRCVDILDAYATIGWPAAVKLLSEMERPG